MAADSGSLTTPAWFSSSRFTFTVLEANCSLRRWSSRSAASSSRSCADASRRLRRARFEGRKCAKHYASGDAQTRRAALVHRVMGSVPVQVEGAIVQRNKIYGRNPGLGEGETVVLYLKGSVKKYR